MTQTLMITVFYLRLRLNLILKSLKYLLLYYLLITLQLKQHSQMHSLKRHYLNWLELSFENIVSGVTADGVSYLKLFLTDYCELFNVQNVNVSCGKCLKNAYLRYIKNFENMETPECGYKLKPKFENIPLEFGSSVFVNNRNITKEYAEKLLSRENGKDLFEIIPEKQENGTQDKVSRNPRKKGKSKQEIGDL